jgi:peptide/bleomycin uptake transporter
VGSGYESEGIDGEAAVRSALWEFVLIVLPMVLFHPIGSWVRSHWVFQWRLSIMTEYYRAWDPERRQIEGASQRLHEDTQRFARGCDTCMITILNSVTTLAVFVPVLRDLSTKVTPPAILKFAAGSWLVLIAVWSSFVSILVSAVIGRRLLRLEVANQRIEADLRRNLVLLEAVPKAVCIKPSDEGKPAEDEEFDSDPGAPVSLQKQSFELIWFQLDANYSNLFKNFLGLNYWLTSFDQLLIILPYLLVAPLLFAPPETRVALGTLVQLSDSFAKVFDSLSVIADSWVGINEFASAVVRLRQFEVALYGYSITPEDQTTRSERCDTKLVANHLARSDDANNDNNDNNTNNTNNTKTTKTASVHQQQPADTPAEHADHAIELPRVASAAEFTDPSLEPYASDEFTNRRQRV